MVRSHVALHHHVARGRVYFSLDTARLSPATDSGYNMAGHHSECRSAVSAITCRRDARHEGTRPTRLMLAGTGAGLLAGAQGLLVYSLYCSEMSVPFWGVWYVLAIVITAGIGAALAPIYLRW